MVKKSVQTQDKFILRMPDGMRDDLKKRAEKSKRTMTAEILARLEWSFAAEEEFAKHQAKVDTRSELAAQRIMNTNLTTRLDPTETRFSELEAQIAIIKEQLHALIPDYPAGDKIEAIEARLAKLEAK